MNGVYQQGRSERDNRGESRSILGGGMVPSRLYATASVERGESAIPQTSAFDGEAVSFWKPEA
jgi:hypothetical protein